MRALVLGPNGSGKSKYAEKLAAELSVRGGSGRLLYIATMLPFGEEGLARVEKHRRQREHMGFITVEKPFNVSEMGIANEDTVLLEDVSNLLSNAMFGMRHSSDVNDVFADIEAMCRKCGSSVLVTIDGLAEEPRYSAETIEYIRALKKLNGQLCEFADTVINMRGGTAVLGGKQTHAMD